MLSDYSCICLLLPDYITQMLSVYRSSGSSLLAVPQSKTKTFGDAALSLFVLRAVGAACRRI